MTNEEFLQRYDSGKLHFTKYEINMKSKRWLMENLVTNLVTM